jgi:hypothetical protein
MVFCPVVAVVMLEIRVTRCVDYEDEVTSSSLMMGVKTPETC